MCSESMFPRVFWELPLKEKVMRHRSWTTSVRLRSGKKTSVSPMLSLEVITPEFIMNANLIALSLMKYDMIG
jgi:hypothetical protein